jgi:methionine synthase II (cobalamin-independent)
LDTPPSEGRSPASDGRHPANDFDDFDRAGNPRHGLEWSIWRDRTLPDDKVLIPGVIDTSTNYVEHPDLVAERIIRFANVVGRNRVIA